MISKELLKSRIEDAIKCGDHELYEELLVDLIFVFDKECSDECVNFFIDLFELFKSKRVVDGTQLYLAMSSFYGDWDEVQRKKMNFYLCNNKCFFVDEGVRSYIEEAEAAQNEPKGQS